MPTASRTRTLLGVAGLLLAAACGADAPGDGAPPRCRPSPGVSARPASIAEMVALVNALPMPVTVPCLLESLDRPLVVQPVLSQFSLQPAEGARSPRFLLLLGSLVASAAPEDVGSDLLEMGEFVAERRTLKAEIHFPVEAPLGPADPFTGIRLGAGTTCGICHFSESRHPAITETEAFASTAFRPGRLEELDLAAVAASAAPCDAAVEPARCRFFEALFGHGEIVPGRLPDTLTSFTGAD